MKKILIFFIAVLLAILPVMSSCGQAEDVPPAVVISPLSINMSVGDVYTLDVSVFPKKYQNTDITWTVSDSRVVLCEDGKITAIAPGEAIVYASVGSARKSCRVSVGNFVRNMIVSETVALSASEKELIKNAAEVSVSAPDVISIEEDSVVAHKVGEATISARFKNGDVVTVAHISVREINLTCDDIPFTLITNPQLGTEILISELEYVAQLYDTDNYFVQFKFNYKRVDELLDENLIVNFIVKLYSSEVEGEFCRDNRVTVKMNIGDEYTYIDTGFLAKLQDTGNRHFWIEIVPVVEEEK